MRQPAEIFERQVGQVAKAVAAGVSVADAAREAGVSRRTVQRWIAQGRDADADPTLRRLALRVEAARRRQRFRFGGDRVISSLGELHRIIDSAARAGSVDAMKLVHQRLARQGL